MSPAAQYELPDPPKDSISSISYAPDSPTLLLVSSWDSNLYLYDASPADPKLLRTFPHRAPILSACFGDNDNEAFTACMDWSVRKIDFETGEMSVLSTHTAPVRSVAFDKQNGLLISASWDSTIHIHNLRTPTSQPTTISLPAKPFSISLSPSKLVVAMSSRLVHIYTLDSLLEPSPQPWQTRESSLKFQTRSVACMPNSLGYATSSIEGRVSVEFFDPSSDSQSEKYAFKCHRQPSSSLDGTDVVYPVNALAFHPQLGSFASGGGDGVVALWDAGAKRRIRQYQKYTASVAALAWSCDGRFLAVGVCPGLEDGVEEYSGEGRTRVFVRELAEGEAKGKKGK